MVLALAGDSTMSRFLVLSCGELSVAKVQKPPPSGEGVGAWLAATNRHFRVSGGSTSRPGTAATYPSSSRISSMEETTSAVNPQRSTRSNPRWPVHRPSPPAVAGSHRPGDLRCAGGSAAGGEAKVSAPSRRQRSQFFQNIGRRFPPVSPPDESGHDSPWPAGLWIEPGMANTSRP
jgi:hypothetical protein